jgi:hypothetical protein
VGFTQQYITASLRVCPIKLPQKEEMNIISLANLATTVAVFSLHRRHKDLLCWCKCSIIAKDV